MLTAPQHVEPGWYRHFKGDTYLVLCLAHHHETLAVEVIYQGKDGRIWRRSVHDFLVNVETPAGPTPRFTRVFPQEP